MLKFKMLGLKDLDYQSTKKLFNNIFQLSQPQSKRKNKDQLFSINNLATKSILRIVFKFCYN